MKHILLLSLFFVPFQIPLLAMQQKKYNKEKTKELQSHVHWLVVHGDIHEDRIKEGAQNIIKLVKEGADPNAESNTLQVLPISWAAARGFLDAVNVLLEYGANPKLQDSIALFDALESRHSSHKTKEQMVRLMLEYGVDPNVTRENKVRIYTTDKPTLIPLLLAYYFHPYICHVLFEYGADWKVLPEDHRKWMLQKLL